MKAEDLFFSPLGFLKPHFHFPEWLVSEAIKISYFGGVPLEFVFDDELVPGTDDFVQKKKAVDNFLALPFADAISDSPFIFENYKYVRERFLEIGWEPEEIRLERPEDIWTAVHPNSVVVSRRPRRDEDVYISVECNCDWEIEHGLQLVFRQGKVLTRVSSYDGHLTESDAFDMPDSDDKLLSRFAKFQ